MSFGDVTAASSAEPPAAPSDARTLCPIVVGRTFALESIAHMLSEVDAGKGRTMLISGEAGIGKTRLVAEATKAARARGFAVLHGNCFEPDRMVPYAPVVDLLRLLPADFTEREPGGGLARGGDILGEMLESEPARSPASVAGAEQGRKRRRMFEALTKMLSRVADGSSAIVAVEDIHWSDKASLEFLEHFVWSAQRDPIFVVLTYRSEEIGDDLASFLADMDRRRLVAELRLESLTRLETGRMLEAILGRGHPLVERLRDPVFALTEGNPFFVEEVLGPLVAATGTGSDEMTADSIDRAQMPIPRAVRASVRQRMSRLSDSARRTIELAAVAGRRFDFGLLAILQGCADDELLEHMKELIRAQLVVEESADQFSFRHALTRYAIYSELLTRERRALHLRVAEAAERLWAGSVDLHRSDLAHHFFEAQRWERAYEYARLAGERALEVYAPATAVDHFSRALAAASELGWDAAETTRSRGRAHARSGNFDEARADFESALDVAHGRGDRYGQWEALVDLAELWAARDYGRSGEYCRRALEVARAMGDPRAQARSLNRLGNWHVNIEDPAAGRSHHGEALEIAQAAGDERAVAETHDFLGTALLCCGDLDGAVAEYEIAAERFRGLDDLYGIVLPLATLGARAGDYHFDPLRYGPAEVARALEAGEESITMARRIGWPSGEAFASTQLGMVLASRGDYGRALERAHEGCRIALEIEEPQRQALAHTALGEIYLDLLALPAARTELELATALARKTNTLVLSNMAIASLVTTCVEQGRLQRAESILAGRPDRRAALESFTRRLVGRAAAELALARGRFQQAEELTGRILESLGGAGAGSERRVGPPGLGRLRAEVLGGLGRYREALEALASERDAATSLGVAPLKWRADAVAGRLNAARGRGRESAAAFACALATIEELAESVPDEPMEALGGDSLRANFRGRAVEQLSAAEVRRLPPTGSPAGLTRREAEVLSLIAAGRTNTEIAAALVLSVRTVEHHVSSILAKTGARRRSGAVAYAHRHGLVTPSDPTG